MARNQPTTVKRKAAYLRALAVCRSHTEAAIRAGVSYSTPYLWLKTDAHFRSERAALLGDFISADSRRIDDRPTGFEALIEERAALYPDAERQAWIRRQFSAWNDRQRARRLL